MTHKAMSHHKRGADENNAAMPSVITVFELSNSVHGQLFNLQGDESALLSTLYLYY